MGGMPTDPPQTASALNVVLVEPEIAGNVGAVGRSCVAGGATLWLVRPLGFLLDDRRIRRAGLDYWEHLELRVVDGWAEVEAALRPGRLWRFSTKAERLYTDADFRPGDALVFGSESRGLPGSILGSEPALALRIPIRPAARSLNLANSASIALFEALRQLGVGAGQGA